MAQGAPREHSLLQNLAEYPGLGVRVDDPAGPLGHKLQMKSLDLSVSTSNPFPEAHGPPSPVAALPSSSRMGRGRLAGAEGFAEVSMAAPYGQRALSSFPWSASR